MNIISGDLWDELGKADLILVPTNMQFDRNGHLIMGAGVAKQAKERFPDAPRIFAQRIVDVIDMAEFYGVVSYPIQYHPKKYLGTFQTKYRWSNPSCLDLIAQSTFRLRMHAHKFERIVMPYLPGCGLGELNETDVLPILEELPDNVYVIKRTGIN